MKKSKYLYVYVLDLDSLPEEEAIRRTKQIEIVYKSSFKIKNKEGEIAKLQLAAMGDFDKYLK